MTLIFFRLSLHAIVLQPFAEITVILGPLVAIYCLSRRFEYAADRVAVDFTGEPETAIKGLANLHRIHDVPAQCDGFTELFMTHPPLADRVQAIARAGQIPYERLSKMMDEVFGVREGLAPQG